jgi:hypothetical protein
MYYRNNNSPKSLYLGSWLTKQTGNTGAGLIIGGLVAGAGYGLWQYGSDISSALFGTSSSEISGPGLIANTVEGTSGIFGSGGFSSTLSSWGSSLWGDLKSVADYVGPSVGKVAVAVAPVALTLAVSSEQQNAAIKAKQKADEQAIAAQAAHDKAIKDAAAAAGVPEVVAQIGDMFGIAPQNVVTYGAISAGALVLLLLLTKRKRG